jgi:HK97 family phage portal protein
VSEDVAKLPVRVYRKTDGRREYLETHQAYRLLARMPNPFMTSVGFREAMTHWAMAWGNSFAEIQRDPRGGVAALIPIHPGYVTIETETPAGEPLIFYRVTGKRGMRILFEEEMFHLRNIGDGIIGYNVAALATNSIGLTSSANQYASTFFNSGGRPAGLLSVTESLSAEGRDRLREELKRVHGGADNTNKILVLDQGMTFVPFGVPPETSQMLETRRYQTEEICRWFRVPSHKVGERDGITYAKAAWKPAQDAKEWPRARLWHGLACENIVQAVANDLLRDALRRLDAAGQRVILHVHDEIVLEADDVEAAAAQLEAVMVAPPAWAAGLPLAAEVNIRERYGK